MEECLERGNCDADYDVHIEEITRLQMLIKIQEEKLFELMDRREEMNAES